MRSNLIAGVIWFVVVTAVILTAAAVLYFMAFIGFTDYDDEGFAMISIQAHLDGVPLYDRLFAYYGPAYFLFYKLVYTGLQMDVVTHNANRMLAFVLGLVTSLLFGLAAFRYSRSPFLALIVIVTVAARAGYMILSEPGHPQQLILIVLALMILVAMDRRRPAIRDASLAVFASILVMTKINAGVFAVATLGVVLAAEFRERNSYTRAVWYLAAVTLVSMPILLMRAQLFDASLWAIDSTVEARRASPWIWFTVVQVCSLIAWLNMLGQGEITAGQSQRAILKAILPTVAIFIISTLAMGTYPVVLGSSVRGTIDGIVLRHMSFGETFSGTFDANKFDVIPALVGLAAVGVIRGNPKLLQRAAFAKSLAALQVVLALLYIVPYIGVLSAYGDMKFRYGYALAPWSWLLLIPMSARRDSKVPQRPLFTDRFISLLLIAFNLYIYPVAGSQRVLVEILGGLVAAMLVYRGATELIPASWPSEAWRNSMLARITRPVGVGAALILVVYGLGIAGTIRHLGNLYATELPARQLRGMEHIRLFRPVYAELLTLVANVRERTDAHLSNIDGKELGGHHLNSLYFWTDQRPPTYFLGNEMWYRFLNSEEKNSVRDALDKHERIGLVIRGDLPPDDFFTPYLESMLVPSQHLGRYILYVTRSADAAPSPVWLVSGKAAIGSFEDQIPLINGLFEKLAPGTISLWFQTDSPGVVIGVQDQIVRGAEVRARRGRPGVYIGVDGRLRTAFSGISDLNPQVTSPSRVTDNAWHHLVIQLHEGGKAVFLDGMLIGSSDIAAGSEVPTESQLGGGVWKGYPSTDGDGWRHFNGTLRDVMLFPGLIAPDDIQGHARL